MSSVYIPQGEPVDMRSIGFMPKIDDDLRPIKTPKELIVCHESGEPLKELFIEIVGKTKEEIWKEVKDAEKQGLVENSRDAFRIRLLERRLKPEAFICRVKAEQFKELSDYVNGIQIDASDGTFQQVAPAHARTWSVGNGNPLTGLEVELDFGKVRKNFEESGKFSKISECTWDQMKQMR